MDGARRIGHAALRAPRLGVPQHAGGTRVRKIVRSPCWSRNRYGFAEKRRSRVARARRENERSRTVYTEDRWF